MRTRTYNRVAKATSQMPEGELLTDKELSKFKRNNSKRDWPETQIVTVAEDKVYWCFGVRKALEWKLKSTDFKAGWYTHNGAETVYLEYDHKGSARYKVVIKTTVAEKVVYGKWQRIKFDAEGRAYIQVRGENMMLHRFSKLFPHLHNR